MNKKVCVILIASVISPNLYSQQNDLITPNDPTTQDSTSSDNLLQDTNIPSRENSEETIIVRATPTSQSMGTQILNAAQIALQPTGNGSITELLKNNPNTQFSNNANSSNTVGELAPENVSFHGEKFYQNNFMIDGLSNNNTINPGANNGELSNAPDGYNANDLPAGGAQTFWINSELIEQLEVFDSNISAKYGNFTGGVVDAKLVDPKLDKASGKISFRTSRDSWTKYHVDEKIADDFDTANKLTYQPQFKKEFYSATFNQPLSDQAGFIFSYNRQISTIPYYHAILGQWENQKRLSETYLFKQTYLTDNGDTLRFTGLYSPHESKYFKKDIKDGSYTNTGGGYRANIEWVHNADWGEMTSLIGYQYEQNKIEHESDSFHVWNRYNISKGLIASKVINWGSGLATKNAQTAMSGGYGEYSTTKDSVTVKQEYELNPFYLYSAQQQFDFGWQVDFYRASYQRENNAYAGSAGNNNLIIDKDVVCQPGDEWCIDGEQYAKTRKLYHARDIKGNYTSYSTYLQNSINYERLEITPGVRLEYDDYLQNFNIAPRFSASYDVFGDRSTRFFGGANRYYGQSILAYKLRNGISNYYQQVRADANSEWVSTFNAGGTDYDVSDLKSPYSDELTLGLSQRLLDTLWTVKWVHRDGKKQFSRETITDSNNQKYYILNNKAKTEGNTYSLTIEPISPYHFSYAEIGWSLGANVVKNKSSSAKYYDTSSDGDDSLVIFDDKLMEQGEMEAFDYNTPWTAFANIDTYFPQAKFHWNQRISYTAGYTKQSSSYINCPEAHSACGDYDGSVKLYTKEKNKDYFTLDWRFSYKQPTYREQSLDITLDVINVLDNVVEVSSGSSSASTTTYKAGRQFWLGASYNW